MEFIAKHISIPEQLNSAVLFQCQSPSIWMDGEKEFEKGILVPTPWLDVKEHDFLTNLFELAGSSLIYNSYSHVERFLENQNPQLPFTRDRGPARPLFAGERFFWIPVICVADPGAGTPLSPFYMDAVWFLVRKPI